MWPVKIKYFFTILFFLQEHKMPDLIREPWEQKQQSSEPESQRDTAFKQI
jgi:hypothetical protein